MKRIAYLGLLLALALPASAQELIRFDDTATSLANRWAQAERAADGRAWIGFSVYRLSHPNHHYGRWYSDHRGPSLGERIYGSAYDNASVRDVAEDVLEEMRRERGKQQKVQKEQAVFLELNRSGEIVDGSILELSQPFDEEGYPVYWLGRVDDAEAYDVLVRAYASTDWPDAQETLVAGVGLLDDLPRRATDFLAEVLQSRADEEVREQAAFWIGKQDQPEGMRVLLRTIERDRSAEVREQAVFGLSQMSLPAATDELIRIARRSDDSEVREKAIFWLGQKASRKAVEALETVVEGDDDTDIKKQAVFALSQLPDDEATTILLRIAQTNTNPEVRKQAIFWLGQQDDPRALEAIISILKS